MPDYNNNCIYKIYCKDKNITEIYIGHTTNFKRRKREHKTSCNNEKSEKYNTYVYKFIRMNSGWDNFYMVQLYNYPCNNIKEACIEERNCIERLGAKLNRYNPYSTNDELRQNKNDLYQINKEKILEKAKEHYQINKEKLLEKVKEYYQLNKEKIEEKGKEKVNCPNCNKLIRKSSLTRHMRSKTACKFNQK